MKARLVKNSDNSLIVLCKNGTIAKATNHNRYTFLTGFQNEFFFTDETSERWDVESPDMALYPGTTLAYISDNNQLVVSDFTPFLGLINEETNMDQYISSIEYAKIHGVSYEVIKLYCRKGMIPGARKIARNWLIPKNAPYPFEVSNRRGPRK